MRHHPAQEQNHGKAVDNRQPMYIALGIGGVKVDVPSRAPDRLAFNVLKRVGVGGI
jgi:hypothetical protein